MPFVKRANTHQTHFEDLVLLGPDGLEELNDKIEGTIDTLENNSGRMNLTTKIDGAPAMICWSSYPGYPDNSIALKGFVNGPQTAISSPEQVDQKYPDEDRADMREMLKYGLEIAKHIPAGQAWQGDCLFTRGSKREEEINGKDYITFQPNKIIYAFSEDNPGYEQIKNADFGIAFHTIYSGEDKHQSFKVDASQLDVPSNIYIMSPALNRPKDTKTFSLDKVRSQFNKLESLEQKLLSNFDYEDLVNNRVFMGYWNTFENANLADKKAVTINENTFIDDLKEYIKNKRTKEFETQVGKLKTDSGKEKAKTKYEQDLVDLQELVDTNKELLTTLVQTLNCAATIKMLLWQGFKQTQFDYSTFYRSRTKGFLPGEMEGVAMSDQDGNIVKIVDRSTFSSYNRDPDIMSGFEHPENKNEELESFKECFNEELVESKPSWNKFSKLLEGNGQTAVIAFGRMNPPTIGHQKLVDTMASLAQGEKAKLFLSHTQDKKKNPLSYEDKIYFAKKAFEPKVEVVETPSRTVIEVLTELYSQGYTDIIYVGGEDRIGGAEDISSLISQYNGQPDKKGNILYDFNSIDFKSAGARSDDSADLVEKASASLARKYATENDFDSFREIVPFDGNTAQELFNKVKSGLGINEEMKILKEDNFKASTIQAGDKSLEDVYNRLIGALTDNPQIKTVIDRIHELTNTIDADVLNSTPQIKEILKDFGNIDILSLIQKMSKEDIQKIFEYRRRPFDLESHSDFKASNLSPGLITAAFNLTPNRVGKGEVLLTLLGGRKASAGDIRMGDSQYEVKEVSKGAVYNQADDKFNTSVDRLFTSLTGDTKKTNYGYQSTLRGNELSHLSKDDIMKVVEETGNVEVKPYLDKITFSNGKEMFDGLAILAAKNACERGELKGKFLLINGLDYKVIEPEDIIKNDVVFTSKPGNSSNRCFKVFKGPAK